MESELRKLIRPIIENKISNFLNSPEYQFLEPHVSKDITDIIDEAPLPTIRSNSCNCEDDVCPHKSVINPLYFYVLNSYISKHITYRKKFHEAFNPKFFPLHFHDTLKNSFPQKNFDVYHRLSIKFSVQKEETFELNFDYDLFEGMEFSPDTEYPVIVSLECNGLISHITIDKGSFLADNFYIPMVLIPYSRIKLMFNKNINGRMICGYFSNVIRSDLCLQKKDLIDDKIVLWFKFDKDYALQINGGTLMFFDDLETFGPRKQIEVIRLRSSNNPDNDKN
ncbi:hypothetical protein [Acanthamoeba castellanii mimivirus]|uniref:Uncharacterized protein L147 n=5 Tax=Mimivirus TaxID=315393 RepID=YL147_MIMIV|nr:hypothetical protein MIMI_gp0165 [Acanthamoeba polyphaga mimivirus]Q5URA1.1 RecName: Full=Uncharacterized protein L147 [Acanthamoeba polyphaga mimivirus]AEQ60326.1 hypothetical protein [Acanthamoeba castellanii mamavirus]AHA45725.1 hypothetical protein HIRU_S819 [Hirudovirus strain Sangsue]ALR83658.1 hypothetical protein [Niemeyer virus]AMK61779.1 hypothetical protein [Samba virus]AMZ02595.1 hypothetical protein [Mimivirus Bombay]EJN41215.1 hypothetical protein lvs_L104 [Acanthamoeba poly